jgi:hypothetical protein
MSRYLRVRSEARVQTLEKDIRWGSEGVDARMASNGAPDGEYVVGRVRGGAVRVQSSCSPPAEQIGDVASA